MRDGPIISVPGPGTRPSTEERHGGSLTEVQEQLTVYILKCLKDAENLFLSERTHQLGLRPGCARRYKDRFHTSHFLM